MMKSMTAFGRATGLAGGKDYTVEMKSVNNRFFDCSVKIPRQYGFLEEKIKSYIQQNGVSRGKVDVFVNVDIVEPEGASLTLDTEYAKSYLNALTALRDTFSLRDDISVMTVAQNQNLFLIQKPEEDAEKDWEELRPILKNAIDAYLEARGAEGKRLADDIDGKIAFLEKKVAVIASHAEENRAAYADKLMARLRSTLAGLDIEIDSARILTECAIFADKIAIDEETVRLTSHFKAFRDAMASDEPVGRRLDFLLQEMNREVNTIGSKSCDASIAALVVDCKCEMEKIREQIQNIE